MKTIYWTQEIDFFWYVADLFGFLVDLDSVVAPGSDSLECMVHSLSSTTGIMAQVFPASVGTWHDVDLVADRVSIGKYKFHFTALASYPAGKYLVEWRVVKSGVQTNTVKEFEIIENNISGLTPGLHLCFIQDLRNNGIASTVTDYKILTGILRGDEFIENYCARRFGAREVTLRVECELPGKLMLPEPLCCLESVSAETLPGETISSTLDNSDMTPFTRHLRGLDGAPSFGADDRNNPKIEGPFVRGAFYRVKGLFGFTEWDGSGTGRIPIQIELASISLGLKYSTSLVGSGSGGSGVPAFAERLIEEKTATQSYKLSPISDGSSSWDMVAGDTELVRLLKPYRRPPLMALI